MAEHPAALPRNLTGFLAGVAALPRAFVELLRSPELWLAALVPTLVFARLVLVLGTLAIALGRPWLAATLPPATNELGRVGVGVASWGFAFVLGVLGFYLALVLAPALSAPALERIVERVEQKLGMPPREPIGFWRELACGFRALALALGLALPLSVLLWLIGVLVPGAAVVTIPLGALESALLVAWGLFDYPLTLRGIGVRERLTLVRDYFPCVAGFGGVFALLFWVPCCGVALLPVGALAATRLSCQILLARPKNAG